MSGWMETLGTAMQAAGAVVAAAQVALFGLGGRAHAERTAPGDRLAAWLARMSKPEERLALVAQVPTMKTSPSTSLRLAYQAGFAAFVGLCVLYVIVVVLLFFAGLVLFDQYLSPVFDSFTARITPLSDAIEAVVRFAAGLGVLYLASQAVGLVLRVAIIGLVWCLHRGGLLLLGVVLWLGRHLETTLRWAALLFGMGAVLEFVSRF